MTPGDRELVSRLCAARAGVHVDPDKVYLIETRLTALARREGFTTAAELLEELRAKREERLIWALVEAMVFNETSFFRDREAFGRFADQVLPELIRARGGAPVRIWSAACGSGEEVYSLAMLIEDRAAQLGGKVELFGSDISERALEKARSGLYTQFEVQRGLRIGELIEHFEKADEMWAISPRIRQTVRWRRVNLLADLGPLGGFDVIFCRYVLQNAVPAMRARILENLAGALAPDGRLILGEGETVTGATDAVVPISGQPALFAPNPAFRAAA